MLIILYAHITHFMHGTLVDSLPFPMPLLQLLFQCSDPHSILALHLSLSTHISGLSPNVHQYPHTYIFICVSYERQD